MRTTGVTSRGIICPIFKEGDDLVASIVKSVTDAAKGEEFELHDKDIIGVTEAVVARTQGNYATTDQIATDIGSVLAGEEAVRYGIIDAVGGLTDALRALREMINK